MSSREQDMFDPTHSFSEQKQVPVTRIRMNSKLEFLPRVSISGLRLVRLLYNDRLDGVNTVGPRYKSPIGS